jgi:hypothetical protein
MRFFPSVFALAIASVGLVRGASATTIDFNTLPGAYFSNFTSYTENGFTVATLTGHFYVDDGSNIVLGKSVFGDPPPDIFQDDGMSGQFAESLTLTKAGGGTFTFDSLELNAFNGFPTYAIVGKLNGTQVYDYAGTVAFGSGGADGFTVLNPGEMSQLVTSVTLSFTQPIDPDDVESTDFDNFIVNAPAMTAPGPVPEPGSIYLLGSGLLCIGGLLRKRLAA